MEDTVRRLVHEIERIKLDLTSIKNMLAIKDVQSTDAEGKQPLEDIEEYSQSSTLHGVRQILSSKSGFLRRTLWLMFFLSGISIMLYFVTTDVIKYLGHPAVTNLEQIHVNSLPFPAVMVCNKNRVKLSYYEQQIQNGSLLAYTSFELFVRQQIWLGNINSTGLNLTDLDVSEQIDEDLYDKLLNKFSELYNVINWEDVAMQGGHQFEDVLQDKFGKGCAGYKDKRILCEVQTYVHHECWLLCHKVTFYKEETGLPVESRKGDLFPSLALEPDVEEEEYTEGHQPGIYLSIHPPYDLPYFNDFLELKPNYRYTLTLEKTAMHQLPLPHGSQDCLDTDQPQFSNPLNHSHGIYSFRACELECRSEAMLDKCGCRGIGYPGINESVCPMENDCWYDINITDTCTHCLQRCHTEDYTVHNSQVHLGYNQFIINIVFKDYKYTEIVQKMAFPSKSLFGSIGGHFGLLVGASILSVIEFLDLLVTLCMRKVRIG